MKILHTSDWHLGQKFIYHDRQEEHRLALDWLLSLIKREQIDALIVAGDIFDIGNPPNYARLLYYNFLKKLIKTDCRHVVIIGGNHDSPSMLEAPQALLKEFNIHVMGAVPNPIEEEIIELQTEDGRLEAVIAAVPFLRDRDIRAAAKGESGLERIERIRAGILEHYIQIGKAVETYQGRSVPIIATGHLYAMGSEASDKQNNIYIGDKENIKADQFPAVFDYVALGHIHRAQAVGGIGKVRYSGSIIPLSFSETKDEKVVNVLHFNRQALEKVQAHPLPIFRRLKTIKGDFETIQEKLEQLSKKYAEGLPSWVEIMVETDKVIPNIDQQLRDFCQELPIEILKIRLQRAHYSIDRQVEHTNLDDLQAIDVFRKKCLSAGQPPEEMEALEHTFLELQNWMSEREE